ncbi:MAG: DUF1800 domain-containing protein [Bryobacterales bacterium]|nr:DUF1800 domain-containing protein [Bryobacteraceae bacterium]MDW8130781.1 DUF1800 domain-containing protein [Bryobacterales bacterium]
MKVLLGTLALAFVSAAIAGNPALRAAASAGPGERVFVHVQTDGAAAGVTIWSAGRQLETFAAGPDRLVAEMPLKATFGGLAVIEVRHPAGGTSKQVVEVQVPGAAVSWRAASRFLEQAAWGPSPESVMRVRQLGFERWIEEQFDAPMSDYPPVPEDDNAQSLTPLQRRFFYNAVHGQDQLRQRVAFALHQIWVVSGLKTNQARMMTPYLQLLHRLAFDNYFTLMKEMTLNPTMGRYLDMVNNTKADPRRGTSPNENYAREIMQLFTIGTVRLNPDGTPQRDAEGMPIPTYSQRTIENLARVFTGWTYPPMPGRPSTASNPAYYNGRMVPVEANHDTGAKELLDGYVIPAGQTAEKDLDDALRHLFGHPNVGPFVAQRLIRALVTSNPSPAYVARVAAVFDRNSRGVRGDLKAVVRAILLDPEARRGDNQPNPAEFGHLREPVLFIAALLRALGASVAEYNPLASWASSMGQNLFFAPSVFNYYSLLHQPQELDGLYGPEFEILTPSAALVRANFADAVVFSRLSPAVNVDLTPLIEMAAVHKWYLTEALNRALLGGRMSEAMRDRILIALDSIADPGLQAQTATYLVASSARYQVQD